MDLSRSWLTLQQIAHPADQATLARTCRPLNELILPILYHTVTWSVSLNTARSLFGGRNGPSPGLKHVRDITLTQPASTETQVVVQGWMEHLEYVLEPDTLRRLFSEFRIPRLNETYATISRLHRSLATSLIHLPSPEELKDWTDVRKLDWYATCMKERSEGMFWIDRDCLSSASQRVMVRSEAGEVVAFEVTTEGPKERIPSSTLRSIWCLSASCRECLRLFLQKRLTSPCRCKNESKLRALTLRNANFSFSDRVFQNAWGRRNVQDGVPNIAAVENVTTLILQDCSGCESLLRGLNSLLYLSLKNLTLISSGESHQGRERFGRSLESVLGRFRGLRTLVVSLRVKDLARLPSISALAHHSETLKELYIDCYEVADNGESKWHQPYSRMMLELLCESCTRLQQVALNFPICGPGYDEQILKPKPLMDLFNFRQSILPFGKLPNLTTLRVLSGPHNALGSGLMQNHNVRRRLETLAADTLRTLQVFGRAPVSVLAFGRAIQGLKVGGGRRFDTEPLCYVVKNPKTKSWYEKSASLERVRRDLVKYDQPQSEILQVQHDSQSLLRFQNLG